MDNQATIDRSKIDDCTKSNIIEAWVLVLGSQYNFDAREVQNHLGTVETMAKKRNLPDFVREDAVVVHQASGIISRPFWLGQWRWDKGRRLVRVGKRHLSLHRICSIPDDRYSRFQPEILEPLKKIWIPVLKEASSQAEDINAARIAVGYSNRFTFKLDRFDLNKFFNFAIRLNILPSDRAVFPGPFNCTFELIAPTNMSSTLSVAMSLPFMKDETITIQTSVQCESPLPREISFDDFDTLSQAIEGVQRTAKLNFFGFCTDLTLEEELGARTRQE